MEENMGKVPKEVLVRETVLNPEESRQFDELYDKTMEEKLITELKELSLIFNKIQDNITRAESLQQPINEILDNEEYKPSDELKNTIDTLENQAEEIYKSFKKLYN